MRAVELMEILKKLKIPVTNTEFPANMKVKPPFIVFVRNNIDTFDADNVVYIHNKDYFIELYTCNKSEEMEDRLIDLLNENEINWQYVSDTRIEEGLYMVVLSIWVLL